MPIVHIHKVTKTINKAIEYGKADKIEDAIDKDDIADTIRYAENDKTGEIVFKTLTNYTHYLGTDFADECKRLLEQFPRKRKIRDGEEPALLFHLVQSFDGYIPPALANQIGRELTDAHLSDYICQVSTHTNTQNIHNHIIFCAVSNKGERYNDCDETMALLRKRSDEICERYGLNILEETREYKPIHWIDKDGKHHSYEPTKRKSDLIANNERNVSSYQNTDSYEKSELKKKTLRETVKNDIDMALVIAKSYEHLLEILRSQYGYKINDKKKNGDWLTHITFTPPSSSKGVRDYKLGDGEFYVRTNLEKFIEDSQSIHSDINLHRENNDVPVFSDYSYDKIDISKINIDKRAYKKDDDIFVVDRGEPEKDLIKDAQNIEREAFEKFRQNKFQDWETDYILHHFNDKKLSERFSVDESSLSYAKNRAMAIQERLDALHFVENNLIYDYKKVNSVMESYWNRYNSTFEKLNEIGDKLNRLRFLVELPKAINDIQNRIDFNKNDSSYMDFEYENDLALLKKYKGYLSNKGLDSDSDKMKKLLNDLEKWESSYKSLSDNLLEQKNKLLSYERSVSIIRSFNERDSKETWSEYDSLREIAKNKSNENEKERIKQQKNSDERMR